LSVTTPILHDPVDDQEWQNAVDDAYLVLQLADAAKYGMLSAALVDVDRCEALLTQGAQLGFMPGAGSGGRPAPGGPAKSYPSSTLPPVQQRARPAGRPDRRR
jgi:hypothetical protein